MTETTIGNTIVPHDYCWVHDSRYCNLAFHNVSSWATFAAPCFVKQPVDHDRRGVAEGLIRVFQQRQRWRCRSWAAIEEAYRRSFTDGSRGPVGGLEWFGVDLAAGPDRSVEFTPQGDAFGPSAQADGDWGEAER